MAPIVRRFRIEGLVQGVGFRWSTVEEARRLGLSGWVRNRRDGSVEVLASGGESEVLALLAWVRHGPPGARVSGVVVGLPPVAGDAPTPFAQHPTT